MEEGSASEHTYVDGRIHSHVVQTEGLSFWLDVDWRLPKLLEVYTAPRGCPRWLAHDFSQHGHLLHHIGLESLSVSLLARRSLI